MTCHMCGNDHSLGEYCSDECENEAIRISEFNAMSFNDIKNGMTLVSGSNTWVDPVVIKKSKQKQKILDFEKALSIFDNICSVLLENKGSTTWGKEPAVVIVELLSKAFPYGDGYAITYNDASLIMERARSPRMVYGVNRGIDMIKDIWKQNYIGEV